VLFCLLLTLPKLVKELKLLNPIFKLFKPFGLFFERIGYFLNHIKRSLDLGKVAKPKVCLWEEGL
jgi:hypothetical protein